MKKFTSMKKADQFIELNNWYSCYVKIRSRFIVFKSYNEYKAFIENNKTLLGIK